VDTERLLTSTRSARRTLDLETPVDPSEIAECLGVALRAANGSNQQSWRWIVVRDPAARAAIAHLYRESYLQMTGGTPVADLLEQDDFGRLMSSTEWLVEHLAEVPLLVLPCYEPYLPDFGEGDAAFQAATLYGSIFPAVWNFQLALHSRGFGTCITTMHLLRQAEVGALLGVPPTSVQGCLLPVARLRPGTVFQPAPRRRLDEVVVVDRFDGPPLTPVAAECE
jgi:nitroreductase